MRFRRVVRNCNAGYARLSLPFFAVASAHLSARYCLVLPTHPTCRNTTWQSLGQQPGSFLHTRTTYTQTYADTCRHKRSGTHTDTQRNRLSLAHTHVHTYSHETTRTHREWQTDTHTAIPGCLRKPHGHQLAEPGSRSKRLSFAHNGNASRSPTPTRTHTHTTFRKRTCGG